MKKQSIEQQKGMTFISWVVVLAFIGFHFMMAIKILPIFAEDHTIAGLWNGLDNDASLVGASPQKIQEHILKKLKINNVYTLQKDNIKIKRKQGFYLVTVEYEPRGTIVGKLDYIASFKHEAKIKAGAE